MNKILKLEKVNKAYNKKRVLEDISFTIETGAFVTITGPSGCGKSTLLRVIMGLESCEKGNIYKTNLLINELPPNERKISIVFQDYSLYPNMTVYNNIALGLKLKKQPKDVIKSTVDSICERIGLDKHKEKYPNHLSGGQQQRVAFARAIVMGCDLLLLDEPFSSVDAQNKITLQQELKQLQKQFNISILMVTHDLEEALSLSDNIIVMNTGRIEMTGTLVDIYQNSKNEFINSFIVDQINKKYNNLKLIMESVI